MNLITLYLTLKLSEYQNISLCFVSKLIHFSIQHFLGRSFFGERESGMGGQTDTAHCVNKYIVKVRVIHLCVCKVNNL
jgi:hypothetical protein